MGKIKNEKVPLGFTKVSFDIEYLFLLNINNINKGWNEQVVNIMYKNVHFTMNDIYVQDDGVATSHSPGPISKCIYSGTWKHIGSQIASTCQEMEPLCRWHLCLC